MKGETKQENNTTLSEIKDDNTNLRLKIKYQENIIFNNAHILQQENKKIKT